MAELHLFEATGIEIEYMIVDRESLAVRPLADRVLAAVNGGEVTSEVELGPLAWSNELVLHVIELKTAGPTATIDRALLDAFVGDVRRIHDLLEAEGATLLPTAMHPLMDPLTETVLWPHDYSPVYQAYDRIFDCKGHGWSNLQSLHLNFPFHGDDELGRLHAAIRLLLPLLPALAASSPMVEGRLTHALDNRLEFYRGNSARIPSVAGSIVPEPVYDRASYEREIFEPMYRDVAPHDPEGVLRDEFLNSRGAIARFDRGAIEIRVIDVQECPRADLSVAAIADAVLRLLVDESLSAYEEQKQAPTEVLARALREIGRRGAEHVIDDAGYLRLLGIDAPEASAGDAWRRLLDRAASRDLVAEPWASTLDEMLRLGPTAARIRRILGPESSIGEIVGLYRRLADCLLRDELLRP